MPPDSAAHGARRPQFPMGPDRRVASLAAAVLVASCGGGSGGASSIPGSSQAAASDIAYVHADEGPTPFISLATFTGQSLSLVQRVTYTISAPAGATAAPAHVGYSIPALQARGAFPGDGSLRLPVFGLYDGVDNAVSVQLLFQDGSVQTLPVTLTAKTYVDPTGVYTHPTKVRARDAHVALGYSYLYVKSGLGTPVIVDVDGKVRWATATSEIASSFSSMFENDEFLVGDQKSTSMWHVSLDGIVTAGMAQVPGATDFSHNIQFGKTGLLAEFNTATDIESVIVEITPDGQVIQTWDVAQIIADFMTRHGDNPALFVRHGVNWLHLNSALYDSSDGTILVSSRENFVMKIGATAQASQDVIWILGDPVKYWHSFPSLASRAVLLNGTPLDYPIGQHALSFTNDGHLMVFNDLTPSFQQPVNPPDGRPYSIVSAYAIDASTLTGQEVWRYPASPGGTTPKSMLCGSAYMAGDDSLLVDYAQALQGTAMRLVGVDPTHTQVAFDYEFANADGCSTGWNAQIFPLDDLSID